MKSNKSFYLIGSYRTYLPIKEMNREAKVYWRQYDKERVCSQEKIKRQRNERWKTVLRCCLITERDLGTRLG